MAARFPASRYACAHERKHADPGQRHTARHRRGDGHGRPQLGLEGPDPEKALSGLSKDITKLMLSHRPSLAPESAKAGASLQLSGHTHGGLILPVTPLIAAFNGGYVSGPYTVDGMPLYVSSGSAYGAAYRCACSCPRKSPSSRLQERDSTPIDAPRRERGNPLTSA